MIHKDMANNKLLILLYVESFNMPLTNTQITEFFLKKYIMNYFELQQLLSELVETEHLDYMEGRNSKLYSITPKGSEALELFHSRIDQYVKDMIIAYVRDNRDRIRRESQLTAEYNRIGRNEFEVLLRVTEGDIVMLELKLNVINAEQAKNICTNWKIKAPEVYRKIMESLI